MELWGKLDRDVPLILVTHYAPWGTRCDGLKRRPGQAKPVDLPAGDGGGSRVVRKIMDQIQPELLICGHYHISFGERDCVGRTIVVNPGPNGMILEI